MREQVRTRRISDATKGLQKLDATLSKHSIALESLDLGPKYYHALVALVSARSKRFNDAVDACRRCLHLLTNEDGCMLGSFAAAMQADDAIFTCRLKSVVDGSCGWAHSELVESVASEMLRFLRYLRKRFPYAWTHQAMYEMVNDLHLNRRRKARKRLKRAMPVMETEYVAMRMRFLYGVHALELGRAFESRELEDEGEKTLEAMQKSHSEELQPTYETRQAEESLKGESIL